MTRCLIIGGGIAGSAAAISLLKAGLAPVIYEAYDRTADATGGFLTVAINGLDAADTLGVKERIRERGFDCPDMTLYLGNGRKLIEFENGGTLADGSVGQTIMRSDLYSVLRAEAEARGIPIHYGKRLVAARETATGVIAEFADGSTEQGDILIGADGLRSAVRTIIDPNAPQARQSALLNTGGVVRGVTIDGPPGNMHMVFGKKCFYSYILAPDGAVWWFANPMEKGSSSLAAMDVTEVRDRLIAMVKGDNTPMAEILASGPAVMKPYGTYDFPSVPKWHTNRMVILGDAAHAASPASGQGASMAFEDAVTLGKCLRDFPDPADAFAAFVKLRRERVEKIVAFGKANGDPKEQGTFYRIIRDMALKAVFAKKAKNPDDNTWMHQHHIDWEVPATR